MADIDASSLFRVDGLIAVITGGGTGTYRNITWMSELTG